MKIDDCKHRFDLGEPFCVGPSPRKERMKMEDDFELKVKTLGFTLRNCYAEVAREFRRECSRKCDPAALPIIMEHDDRYDHLIIKALGASHNLRINTVLDHPKASVNSICISIAKNLKARKTVVGD